jgi:hypothetical protein
VVAIARTRIARTRMLRRLVAGLILLPCLVVLTACAAGPNDAEGVRPHVAGFWQGLWHGLISPITFVVSLFNDQVGMYEVHNDGGWYNFGFLLGVMIVFSGGGAGSSRASRTRARA